MNLITNNPVAIYTFYDRYAKQKNLLLPPHQKLRGDVWSLSKKRKWWDDIQTKKMVCGCIVTYKLANDKREVYYINDGANRVIHSIIQFIENSKAKGLQDGEIKDLLYRCNISEQVVEYDDEQEAIDHYVAINMGSTATPHEVLHCRFVAGLHDYENVWKPIFERLDDIVNRALIYLGCKIQTDRDNVHKKKRDNLAMFVRFARKDTTRWSPRVSNNVIISDRLEEISEVENKCLELFKELGTEAVSRELDAFEKHIQARTTLFHQIWHEVGNSPAMKPNATAVRWWISLGIYHRNNGFEHDAFRTFTSKWLKKYKGRTTMIYLAANGSETNTNTQMSKINSIPTALRAVGMTVDEFEKKEVRKSQTDNLRVGYVHSHVNAFSESGEGETIPENATDNLHRLNRDMTPDVVARLKKFNKF